MTRSFHLILVLVVLLVGCRNQKKDAFIPPGQTDLLVTRFDIQGVNAVSESELTAGLATRKSRWTAKKSVKWVPLLGSEKQYFNHVYWQQDRERIRTFYHARGYFDARIVAENLIEDRNEKTIRIALQVAEGEPSRITSIEIDGGDRLVDSGDLLGKLPIATGDIFTQAGYVTARQRLKTELEQIGYAYAQVDGRVIVEPRELKASVVFYVDPGPLSTFGEVRVEGTEQVPEGAIRTALTFEPGERFSPEKMAETQERIYDLGVFSVVKVSAQTEHADPDADGLEGGDTAEVADEDDMFGGGLGDLLAQAHEDAAERAALNPVVDVIVQVKEAKLWSVRVGAGVAAEVVRQDAHGRFDWTSRNFLGGLRKLEHFNSAGYAWAPSVFRSPDERNEGLIVDSELRFTQPRFLERFTTLELGLRFQREVEPGFKLTSPTAKVGVRRRFFRVLTAELSYNFALFILSDLEPALLDPSLRLQPEYVLEYFEQRVALDFRNDLLNPTRGWRVEAQLQESSRYVGHIPGIPGGEFDYIAPTLSLDMYFPIFSHVLAMRGRVATIYNLGDNQPPIPQRMYAGGADSMRAFGRHRLAIYSVSGDALPIGGMSRVEGSVEPRFRIVRNLGGIGDFWIAPFMDAATVTPGALFFRTDNRGTSAESLGSITSSLLYGAGLGAWWVTPIGPVRLDVAYRISNIIDDARFRRCAVEPNVAGTCNGAFIAEAADPVRAEVRSPINVILGIGHSF